MMPNVKADIL